MEVTFPLNDKQLTSNDILAPQFSFKQGKNDIEVYYCTVWPPCGQQAHLLGFSVYVKGKYDTFCIEKTNRDAGFVIRSDRTIVYDPDPEIHTRPVESVA